MESFLADEDPLIQREAIRAVYDTRSVDGPSGLALAGMGGEVSDHPASVQRRIVAANYRRGGGDNARNLVEMAGSSSLDSSVREAALQGLLLWEKKIDTDPVLGTYRPLPDGERSMERLGETIGAELKALLATDLPPELAALALNLADQCGVELDASTLR